MRKNLKFPCNVEKPPLNVAFLFSRLASVPYFTLSLTSYQVRLLNKYLHTLRSEFKYLDVTERYEIYGVIYGVFLHFFVFFAI